MQRDGDYVLNVWRSGIGKANIVSSALNPERAERPTSTRDLTNAPKIGILPVRMQTDTSPLLGRGVDTER